MSKRLPSHDSMVDNIRTLYALATPSQVEAGRAWYPAAGRMAEAIAQATGHDRERIAYAIAALSPRNPWRWNVADAYAFAVAARHGVGQRPVATTFGGNADRAWAILTGAQADPWRTAAPKVRSFVGAIMGNPLSVVVDVWAVRVATMGAQSDVRAAEYGPIAEAYRAAAEAIGDRRLAPAQLQAVTWLVAQDLGLGSGRRGRHDRGFKRGTSTFVRNLFE